MGADGGVSWVRLLQPSNENYKRCKELLSPFWEMFESGNANWQQDQCDDWHDDNPEIREPFYLYGYYGTSQNLDLNDLCLILNEDYICIDSSLTFGELIEDLRTRPLYFHNEKYNLETKISYLFEEYHNISQVRNCLDVNGRRLSILEVSLWQAFHIWFEEISPGGKRASDIDPIRNMKFLIG